MNIIQSDTYQRFFFFIFIENPFILHGPWRIRKHIDTLLIVDFKVFVVCTDQYSMIYNNPTRLFTYINLLQTTSIFKRYYYNIILLSWLSPI